MPLIRAIYWRAVQDHGADPVSVSDVEARTLIEKRWAVAVTEDDLAEMKKAELVGLADEVGADVKPRDAKGHFVKAIAEAQGSE